MGTYYLQLFLSVIVLNLLYTTGQLFLAGYVGAHDRHYYLGRPPYFIHFSIKELRFSIGLYVPLPWFSKIYRMEEGQATPIRYPWQFTQASLGKRALVTLGGLMAWMVLAYMILVALSWQERQSFITAEETNRWGLYPSDRAKDVGFERGDRVLLFNGKPLVDFYDLNNPNKSHEYLLQRKGNSIKVLAQPTADGTGEQSLFLYLDVPFEVDHVEPSSPAERAGLQVGDRIVQVDSIPILKDFELRKQLLLAHDSVLLLVERTKSQAIDRFHVRVLPSSDHRLGIGSHELIHYTINQRSFGESLIDGAQDVFFFFQSSVLGMYYVIFPDLKHPVLGSGPVRMASMFNMGSVSQF